MANFACEICGQELPSEAAVWDHVRREHEEKEVQCPLCDLNNITVEELKLHINTAHEDILSPGKVGGGDEPRGRGTTGSMGSTTWMESTPFMGSTAWMGSTTSMGSNGASSSHPEANHDNGHMNSVELKTFSQCGKKRRNLDEEYSETWRLQGENLKCTHSSPPSTNSQDSDQETDSGRGLSEGYLSESLGIFKEISSVEYKDENSIPLEDFTMSSEKLNIHKRPNVNLHRTQSSASSTDSYVDVMSVSSSSDTSEKHNTLYEGSPFRKVIKTLNPRNLKLWAGSADSLKKIEEKGIWKEFSEPEDDGGCGEEVLFDSCSDDEDSDVENKRMSGFGFGASFNHGNRNPLKSSQSWGGFQNVKPQEGKPKETLLSLSKKAKNIESAILCPICGLGSYDPNFLQAHIDCEHFDQCSAENGQKDHRGHGRDASRGACGVTDKSLNTCPVCGREGFSLEELNTHVNSHFDSESEEYTRQDRTVAARLQDQEKQLKERREREERKRLQAQYAMDETGSYRKQAENNLERAVVRGELSVADYHQRKNHIQRQMVTGEEDSTCRVSGILDRLANFYQNGVDNISYVRLVDGTDFFSSSVGCKGWGCGYRNLQMLLSAMVHVPAYRDVVFNGRNAIPCINHLQRLIEGCWEKGFDVAGMEQLGGRLHNTRKWIGATEIVALLQSLRIKCKLLDFHRSTGLGGTHPKLFEWVRDYFGKPATGALRMFGKDNSIRCSKMPLYFQHQGHSRTIVGCETLKDNSIRLLIFDPGVKIKDMEALKTGVLTAAKVRLLRKTLGQVKHKQYQIVAVERLIASDREYEEGKLIASERIPDG